jgi:hypothetical protein
LEYLAKIERMIKSEEFLNKARKRVTYFTRRRKVPFVLLMYFLIQIVHESLQTAARRFFAECGIIKKITEQSISEARNKLKWEGFQILYETTV